ncbi:MAG: acetyl-CoA C-acetyltransferase [Thermoleophilaceae bacterium]|jgi:acetyl-CoA C-acetyltransferase|nr:acetyl-CoA C-acetyltransferase [Thermoleophilaceae bacterium]
MPEAVVVAAGRSPIGRASKGSLVDVRPDDLSASVISAVLESVPQLDPGLIEDVIWGCGHPAGEAGNCIARHAAVLAGLDAPGVTVNRYCSSSLQTVGMAMHAIRAGQGRAFVAGGVETISRFFNGMADDGPPNPRFDEARERSARRAEGGADTWTPATGLPDVYLSMGETAENVAQVEDVSREEMDAFAYRSQRRAAEAQERGFFDGEIIPIELPDGTTFTRDDSPRPNTTMEKLAELKPVFRPDGRVTAGNACPLNDGAAAAVVVDEQLAADLGLTPLARIVSTAASAVDPEIMGLGPVAASRIALERAGMTIADVDLVEINEAFAAQVIPSARRLDVDEDKLNVNGGAIALGHPYGMTGTRILTTLIRALRERDGTIGLETMCVGGGQGMAMVVERLS